jgi:hypothetical protein
MLSPGRPPNSIGKQSRISSLQPSMQPGSPHKLRASVSHAALSVAGVEPYTPAYAPSSLVVRCVTTFRPPASDTLAATGERAFARAVYDPAPIATAKSAQLAQRLRHRIPFDLALDHAGPQTAPIAWVCTQPWHVIRSTVLDALAPARLVPPAPPFDANLRADRHGGFATAGTVAPTALAASASGKSALAFALGAAID